MCQDIMIIFVACLALRIKLKRECCRRSSAKEIIFIIHNIMKTYNHKLVFAHST